MLSCSDRKRKRFSRQPLNSSPRRTKVTRTTNGKRLRTRTKKRTTRKRTRKTTKRKKKKKKKKTRRSR